MGDQQLPNANAPKGELFGQSITKEVLQQSRKEIAHDQLNHDEKNESKNNTRNKNLKLEIDEHNDYEK